MASSRWTWAVCVVVSAIWAGGCGAVGSEPDEDVGGAYPQVGVSIQALGAQPINGLPTAQTTNEDSPLTLSVAAGNPITVSDADNTFSTVQITVTNGVFFLGSTVSGIGTPTGNGTNTVVLSGQINIFTSGVLTGGINKALDGAHFDPAANYFGPASLQMNSSDTNGEVDFDILAISVTSFNDAPVNNPPAGTQAATEDVPLAFTIPVTDVDIGSATMLVSLLSSNGTLITLPPNSGIAFSSGDGTSDVSMTFSGTLSEVSAALNGITITAPLNFIGSSTLVITSNDQGASGSGTAGTDTDTVNINWAAVNDAPVNGVPAGQTTTEETPVTFSSGNGNALSVVDADGPTTMMQVTLAASGGVITLGASGVTFTAGDGVADASMTFSGTLASLNSAMANTLFTPNLNFNGPALLTMVSSDLGNSGSGGTKTDTDMVAIAVSGVNDAPVNGVPAAQIIAEDMAAVFSSANGNPITVSDADAANLEITLTAVQGTLTLAVKTGVSYAIGDGTADPTIKFSGTPANLYDALNGLTFRPSSNYSGAASLTILTSDRGSLGAGGTLTDEDVIAITVDPGNDLPNAVDDGIAVLEDSLPTHVLVRDNDNTGPDVGETLTVTGVSTPLHGTTTLSATDVTYQPSVNYAGIDSFTYTVADGNGGSATATVTVMVTDTNDPPIALNDIFSVQQNTPTMLSVLANDSGQPDLGETLLVTTVSAPMHGTAVAASGGTQVSYTSTPGYTGSDAFGYTITDGRGGSASAMVSITVTAVNTQPVNALPGAQIGNEDSSILFSSASGSSISVSDSNSLMLDTMISVTNGTFTLGSTTGLIVTGNGTASVTAQGTIAALNMALDGSRYTPTANFNGGATLTLNSSADGDSDQDVLTLSITALNDAPVNSVPKTVQAAVEDVPRTFGDISISDVDVGAGELEVTLTADNGTLITLGNEGGLSFSEGKGNAASSMTFTGTLADINSALNGVTVTSMGNFIGESTLIITTSDQGNSGSGGASQDVDTVSLTWGSVNDPPVNTVPGRQSNASGVTFSTLSDNALRVSDADVSAGLMQITLSTIGGSLTLGDPSLVSFITGDGTLDASMSFTGTLSDVNTALEGTVYTPTVSFMGSASLTLVSSDLGNSGSGGAKTDTDTVALGDASEGGVKEPDSDGDGIPDKLEVSTTKTDPLDDDSDDDGLLDGDEDLDHDGVVDNNETSPNKADTDEDGLTDGQELGLAEPEGTKDTDLDVFVADEDPTTTTDPTFADSDGDGKHDGIEDANQNGKVDEGETDPIDDGDAGDGGPRLYVPRPARSDDGCSSAGAPTTGTMEGAATLLFWLAGVALWSRRPRRRLALDPATPRGQLRVS